MMNMYSWFSQLSARQRFWLFGTAAIIIIIVGVGLLLNQAGKPVDSARFSVDMSIRDIAPKLNVTGKALARELKLPLDVSKQKPLKALGVAPEELQHVTEHLLAHRDSTLKYYVYVALVLGGLVFLVRLGRPDLSDVKHRREWYPRTPYIVSLILSVVVAGFFLGKSPNPMEGVVKVFKSMVGLYPDPIAKAVAFLFFIVLAVIGNKIICGWACPFGALQELIYSVPILRKIKQRKLPFRLTNTIRAGLFAVTLLFLFGIIGGQKGTVIYHYVNPFNLFNLDFEALSILLTVILSLLAASLVYRPFCQFICPFGFISWITERFSIARVRIDKDTCTECGACIKACPLEAAEGLVYDKVLPADCFSCARCLNVCPVDAIQYKSVFKKGITNHS
jgi:NAD-dependent dihydropyrimidine dehydrogenase PreA subunit